jgi:hypothetical protein
VLLHKIEQPLHISAFAEVDYELEGKPWGSLAVHLWAWINTRGAPHRVKGPHKELPLLFSAGRAPVLLPQWYRMTPHERLDMTCKG